jgi:hypothetical protein
MHARNHVGSRAAHMHKQYNDGMQQQPRLALDLLALAHLIIMADKKHVLFVIAPIIANLRSTLKLHKP